MGIVRFRAESGSYNLRDIVCPDSVKHTKQIRAGLQLAFNAADCHYAVFLYLRGNKNEATKETRRPGSSQTNLRRENKLPRHLPRIAGTIYRGLN